MEQQHSHAMENGLPVALALNIGFTLLELVGGLLTNSVAILSDAVHDLGDSIFLTTALFLGKYAEREGNQTYTYGYRRYSLVGALLNSVVLVGGSLFVLAEAIPRLLAPQSFEASGVTLIALVGVVVNGLAVLRLRRGQSMNVQVITWHLLEDVLGWVAVLIVGIVSLFVDVPILDPILSILITLYVLTNALNNLRKTLVLFLQASPAEVDIQQVEDRLLSVPGVQDVHHTHLWSLDGEHHVFTTHLVVQPDSTPNQIIQIKRDASRVIEDIRLEHAAVEIDFGPEDCTMVYLSDK